ncbi:unnamed protein product, partial [Polarella glacialis]
ATAGLGRVAEESISDDRWPRTRADSRERLGLQIANQERSSRRHQDAGLSSAVSSEGLGVKGEVLDAARNRDWAAARAAFDRLEKPERVVYNSLLHAADRCNRRREAEIIFSEMQEKSIAGNFICLCCSEMQERSVAGNCVCQEKPIAGNFVLCVVFRLWLLLLLLLLFLLFLLLLLLLLCCCVV